MVQSIHPDSFCVIWQIDTVCWCSLARNSSRWNSSAPRPVDHAGYLCHLFWKELLLLGSSHVNFGWFWLHKQIPIRSHCTGVEGDRQEAKTSIFCKLILHSKAKCITEFGHWIVAVKSFGVTRSKYWLRGCSTLSRIKIWGKTWNRCKLWQENDPIWTDWILAQIICYLQHQSKSTGIIQAYRLNLTI